MQTSTKCDRERRGRLPRAAELRRAGRHKMKITDKAPMKAAPTSSSWVAQRQQLTPPLPALISCSLDRSAPPGVEVRARAKQVVPRPVLRRPRRCRRHPGGKGTDRTRTSAGYLGQRIAHSPQRGAGGHRPTSSRGPAPSPQGREYLSKQRASWFSPYNFLDSSPIDDWASN